MKRILCILSSLDAGGAETFLMKVNRMLDPKEYQFDFVVSREILESDQSLYEFQKELDIRARD